MLDDLISPGWDNLPPELLRKVVSVLLRDWAYFEPDQATNCLRPIRSTCTAWRCIVDADIQRLAVTVPSLRPACLAENFPNATHLDLSRYQHHSLEMFSIFHQLKIRSLVLAEPWNPPMAMPTQSLQHLTYLRFLAEGLLVTPVASQFCEALSKLKQLQELHLCRLLVSASTSQMLARTLMDLPCLNKLVLSGGATPIHLSELYVLLNVDLPQLHTLELMRLGVRMLPRSLSRLVNLTYLAFSGEMMRSVQLQEELLQLTNLKVLDISANLAEQLPGCVLQLTGLRELHAGMNRLGMQAHSFADMQQLDTLVLASNKLLALHDSVWSLTALKHLDLGHNNLSELPAEISSLTGLTLLNVCHNFLTVLPVGLAYLTRLVDLDVSLNTDMRELPAGLGALSLLTRLNASHMRLKQLPADVGGLVSLAHLDVSHNSLHHLAPQLSSLVALTFLEASDNKLHQSAAVPEELVTLTALKVLRLARNRLQSLPEALGAFSALQVLDCSGNRLTSVPRVVGRCTSLQQLLMSSNRLRGLTSGIGNLVRLQLLDLSHNQYRHLPTMTGDLTQLQELLLADNQLEDLPSSCSSLVKVTQLTLHCNRLHVLPPAICRMSGLQKLTLSDNPLLGRDAVVLQLQRQLAGLSVDSHKPLQGAAVPTRMPLFGAQLFPANYMQLRQLQPENHPQRQAYEAMFGLASGTPPAQPLHQGLNGPGYAVGDASLPALYQQGYVCPQARPLLGPHDVRAVEAAMYAQLHIDQQLQQQQQQPQAGARPTRLPLGFAPAAPLTTGANRGPSVLPGMGRAMLCQPNQQPQPTQSPWSLEGAWHAPYTGPGMMPQQAAERAAAPCRLAFRPPARAAVGSGSTDPAAAAGPTQAVPGSDAPAGSTPWASAGSQPGMNLQQLLLASSGSPAVQPLPDGIQWPEGTHQHTHLPPAQHPQQAGGAMSLHSRLPTVDDAEHADDEADAPLLSLARQSGGYGHSRYVFGPLPEPSIVQGLAQLSVSDAPADRSAGPAAAGAAVPSVCLAQAGTGGVACSSWSRQEAMSASGNQAGNASTVVGQQAAQAQDAASSNSGHSNNGSSEHVGEVPGDGPLAAAAVSAGAGHAAAEVDPDEVPSSTPDTECPSDTSSDAGPVADGARTAAMLTSNAGQVSGIDPRLQRFMGGASSSSGGSGTNSSAGGGPVSSCGQHSSCGGSKWGGSSGGGRVGEDCTVQRPTRFQPAEGDQLLHAGDLQTGTDGGAAAAKNSVESIAEGEGQGTPSDERGGDNQPHTAAAAAAQPGEQQRTSGRYFPFNVLEAAWWGS